MTMMHEDKTSYFVSVSCGIHLILLLVAGIYIPFSSEKIQIGNQDKRMMISYMVHDQLRSNAAYKPTLPQSMKSAKSVEPRIKSLKKEKISLEKSITHADNKKNTSMQLSDQSSAIKEVTASEGQQSSELIALLHAAIQAQQRYPESALQMEREGTATIAFMMHLDGAVSQVRVIRSSGTESLDHAALSAVMNAAPFKIAAKHLPPSQQEYKIDVVFELTA